MHGPVTLHRKACRVSGKKVAASTSKAKRAPRTPAAGQAKVAAAPTAEADLAPVVGANLRAMRAQRRYSLEKLAQLSGVSRAMLGQIELGQSAPTINVLWKISHALGVTFSALMSARAQAGAQVLRSADSKRLSSQDQTFSSRALFPYDRSRRVEFYELRLAAGAAEQAEPHAAGTVENLVVTTGVVQIQVGHDQHQPGRCHKVNLLDNTNFRDRVLNFIAVRTCRGQCLATLAKVVRGQGLHRRYRFTECFQRVQATL